MCELLGMSAQRETHLNNSLQDFKKRGGEVGPHVDGWGIARYREGRLHLIKEPVPAAESGLLEMFSSAKFKSKLILAHIRRANPSHFERSYANTHPFERHLWDKPWVFAHNGKFSNHEDFSSEYFTPNGRTDSERIFCWLMDRIKKDLDRALMDDEPEEFVEQLVPYVSEINSNGIFNFLLSNGSWLLAQAHGSLHKLQRTCSRSGCPQRVLLLATEPLTDESWSKVEDNTLLLIKNGRVLKSYRTPADATE